MSGARPQRALSGVARADPPLGCLGLAEESALGQSPTEAAGSIKDDMQ